MPHLDLDARAHRPASRLAVATAALAALLGAAALAPRAAHAEPARLPWAASERVYVTQDCNDDCYDDHVGTNGYAWDFATQDTRAFDVVAPRAGTVVHVKMSSEIASLDRDDADAANYLVIDHGDGTYSVMLHLAYDSLDPAVRCGAFVRRGQRLARTGSTGWSSGNHLHYQLNRIPPDMPQTCECGPDGMACGAREAHWELFWSFTSASGTVPAKFEEWSGASACSDRHDGTQLESRNVDRREEVITIDEAAPGRFAPLRGRWAVAAGGSDGTHRKSAPGAPAAARVSFEGLIARPGVYEIWVSLPAGGRTARSTDARVEVTTREGTPRQGLAFAQNVPGGGYQRLAGQFELSGRAGEGLVLSTQGTDGKALVVDNVVLRRVGEPGRLPKSRA